VPTTPAASTAYQRKAVDLARRCGAVSGELLSHITTADNARDLDALRKLVGDRKLTYLGLSWGSMIGQTYANLFPARVRAILLDGIADGVAWPPSAEPGTKNTAPATARASPQFPPLAQSAAPRRCALAGHGQTVAQRVAELFARAR